MLYIFKFSPSLIVIQRASQRMHLWNNYIYMTFRSVVSFWRYFIHLFVPPFFLPTSLPLTCHLSFSIFIPFSPLIPLSVFTFFFNYQVSSRIFFYLLIFMLIIIRNCCSHMLLLLLPPLDDVEHLSQQHVVLQVDLSLPELLNRSDNCSSLSLLTIRC